MLFLFLVVSYAIGQEIEVYDSYDDFETHLVQDQSKTYVVNFWATWCGPCIKELPYFEQLRQEYLEKDVEVVLVSIDFKDQYEKRLLPFIKMKKPQSRVIHMADPKPNNWIDRVNPQWSGVIPATLFIRGEKEKFKEGEYIDYNELKIELNKFLE